MYLSWLVQTFGHRDLIEPEAHPVQGKKVEDSKSEPDKQACRTGKDVAPGNTANCFRDRLSTGGLLIHAR